MPREHGSTLAAWAGVGAPAAEDCASDRRPAACAGFAPPAVDAVLELKEAADAGCVDVVRDRGAAELDGSAENGLQRCVEFGQAGAGDAAGGRGGADAGAEEAFVGVDVAYPEEQGLVEKCGLDG